MWKHLSCFDIVTAPGGLEAAQPGAVTAQPISFGILVEEFLLCMKRIEEKTPPPPNGSFEEDDLSKHLKLHLCYPV